MNIENITKQPGVRRFTESIHGRDILRFPTGTRVRANCTMSGIPEVEGLLNKSYSFDFNADTGEIKPVETLLRIAQGEGDKGFDGYCRSIGVSGSNYYVEERNGALTIVIEGGVLNLSGYGYFPDNEMTCNNPRDLNMEQVA